MSIFCESQTLCSGDTVLFSLTGKTDDAEETVLTDYLTVSARKREFPEREKQFACNASEGKKILCRLIL